MLTLVLTVLEGELGLVSDMVWVVLLILRTEAIMMAVCKWLSPRIFVRCRPSRILAGFVVRVVRTSGPLAPIVIRPTEDSGLACVLYWKIKLAASAWASHLEGT